MAEIESMERVVSPLPPVVVYFDCNLEAGWFQNGPLNQLRDTRGIIFSLMCSLRGTPAFTCDGQPLLNRRGAQARIGFDPVPDHILLSTVSYLVSSYPVAGAKYVLVTLDQTFLKDTKENTSSNVFGILTSLIEVVVLTSYRQWRRNTRKKSKHRYKQFLQKEIVDRLCGVYRRYLRKQAISTSTDPKTA